MRSRWGMRPFILKSINIHIGIGHEFASVDDVGGNGNAIFYPFFQLLLAVDFSSMLDLLLTNPMGNAEEETYCVSPACSATIPSLRGMTPRYLWTAETRSSRLFPESCVVIRMIRNSEGLPSSQYGQRAVSLYLLSQYCDHWAIHTKCVRGADQRIRSELNMAGFQRNLQVAEYWTSSGIHDLFIGCHVWNWLWLSIRICMVKVRRWILRLGKLL